MRRREFIAGLGSTAAWPVVARGQQGAIPVIAYLSVRSAESDRPMLAAFRSGLNELGFEESRNLVIEYRFADGQYNRVRELATDLVRRQVSIIAFLGAGTIRGFEAPWPELRASQIPVVFNTGGDPVRQQGLVESLSRPGGNFTGVNTFAGELTGKIFEFLHELVPGAATIGVVSNFSGNSQVRDAGQAAAALGMQLYPLSASTDAEIQRGFAALNERRVDAVHVLNSPFFVTRARLFAALAARYKIPATYARREYAEAGGLMSYGYNVADVYRQLGNYAGRILKGDKPADLPVFQPTKFELVINLKTAKGLGLEVPPKLLALADEVIE